MKMLTSLSIFFLITTLAYPQNNITNTLGPYGTFIIKDGSNILLSLSQEDGILNLTNGAIYREFNRMLHFYTPPTSVGDNTFLGIYAGNFTMSGTNNYEAANNTGIGNYALTNLTSGYENSGIGSNTLYNNTSGSFNTAIGGYSLYSNTTGQENTAIGTNSLHHNTTGKQNTAVGNQSLSSNTTGEFNTAVGIQSLNLNTIGISNTAVGGVTLFSNTTGDYNTATGVSALYYNSTGSSNTTSGAFSLRSNTTGNQNTALGVYSLYANTTGDNNTAVGYNSLTTNTTGFQNTAVGHHSLLNNTGNYNTALGYNSGSAVTTGSNLTLLGIDANPSSPTVQNQITLGNSFVTSLRCNVQNISSLSDVRDKKNIKDLNLGIEFLMKIKPRVFNWDRREWYVDNKSDGSKMMEEPTAGFIAQELDEVQTSENAEWLNLVLKDNPDKLEATSGNLLPIIVKAIQDLKKENDELKARLIKFEQMQSTLTTEIQKLEANNNENTKVSLGDQ
jgi:hypothetical protein